MKFGRASKKRLATVRPALQCLCQAVLELGIMDFSVVEGARSKEDQERYFREGKSKLHWPDSKHNVRFEGDLANAVDLVPYINGRLSWRKDHCCILAGLVLATARSLGLDIRWGGNWDCDTEPITDQDFQDLVHFELKG